MWVHARRWRVGDPAGSAGGRLGVHASPVCPSSYTPGPDFMYRNFSGGRGLDFIYTNFRGFFALLLGSDVELDSISRLRDNAFLVRRTQTARPFRVFW